MKYYALTVLLATFLLIGSDALAKGIVGDTVVCPDFGTVMPEPIIIDFDLEI